MCRSASKNQFNFLVYFDACGFESMLSLILISLYDSFRLSPLKG